MSVLTDKAKPVSATPVDNVYVIYGGAGTGKTVIASTFPKTKDKPLLYLDILEGGTRSISASERENIIVVPIETFAEMESVLEDIIAGETTDSTGKVVPLAYSTVVIDSATQMEFLLKTALMEGSKARRMNLGLWGDASMTHDNIWNACKLIQQKTGAHVVVIAHEKEEKNEDNPQFAKTVPAIMTKASHGLCAKASYVWYTKIDIDSIVDEKTGTVEERVVFKAIIDAHPYLLTKCRKPPEAKILQEVRNLTYPLFKKNILDKLP